MQSNPPSSVPGGPFSKHPPAAVGAFQPKKFPAAGNFVGKQQPVPQQQNQQQQPNQQQQQSSAPSPQQPMPMKKFAPSPSPAGTAAFNNSNKAPMPNPSSNNNINNNSQSQPSAQQQQQPPQQFQRPPSQPQQQPMPNKMTMPSKMSPTTSLPSPQHQNQQQQPAVQKQGTPTSNSSSAPTSGTTAQAPQAFPPTAGKKMMPTTTTGGGGAFPKKFAPSPSPFNAMNNSGPSPSPARPPGAFPSAGTVGAGVANTNLNTNANNNQQPAQQQQQQQQGGTTATSSQSLQRPPFAAGGGSKFPAPGGKFPPPAAGGKTQMSPLSPTGSSNLSPNSPIVTGTPTNSAGGLQQQGGGGGKSLPGRPSFATYSPQQQLGQQQQQQTGQQIQAQGGNPPQPQQMGQQQPQQFQRPPFPGGGQQKGQEGPNQQQQQQGGSKPITPTQQQQGNLNNNNQQYQQNVPATPPMGSSQPPHQQQFHQPQQQTQPPTQQNMQAHNNTSQQQQQQQHQGPSQQGQSQNQQQQQGGRQDQQQQQQGQPQKHRMRAKPQGNNRIDSLQMPSPCRDLLVDGHPSYSWPPAAFSTAKTNVPPTFASGTPCIDEGNCTPKFVRPTSHQLPWDDSCCTKSCLPFGAVVSPLCASKQMSVTSEDAAGASSLPLAQLVPRNSGGQPQQQQQQGQQQNSKEGGAGTGDPVRCSRCRAYMNPWNPFAGSGHNWVCAFCGMSNDVSESYFSPIQASGGKRRDHLERPELSKGSYEIDVTELSKYWAENPDTEKVIRPKPMNHLFIIDVSKGAAGHLKPLVSAIREAVDAMPESGFGMCNVSFVTYASTLHFYDFSDPDRMPQMIVPDVHNPFVPLPFNLLCWMNVEEQNAQIHSFLDRLENPDEIVSTVNETGCVIGAAAKVGQLILSDVGGKVILTGTSAPTDGCGVFQERDVARTYGNNKTEHELFKPVPGFWPTLALESAKRHVSFSLFLFPSGHCDLVTIGQICHMTNGKQWLFFNFREDTDGLRLKRNVIRALNDECGYGAILRTRCSSGLRLKGYHGHFTQSDPQDMDLACVDSQSNFFVELKHDGQLEKKAAGIIQCALLYTSRSGRRRVRVHTLRMPVADTISTLFRYSDLEATLHAFLCLGIHEAYNKGVRAARDFLVARTVEMLVGYRLHSQSGSHSGQLLLPENLKLLPLYNLCLMKSDALANGTVVRFDDRIQNIFELLTYPQDRILFYLYPRLFGLHHLTPQNAGEYKISSEEGAEETTSSGDLDQRPRVSLPSVIQLTADNVLQGGIYLLQDLQARTVYLMIGSLVSPQNLENAFGASCGSGERRITQDTMPEWNPRVRRIVQQIIDETGRLVIVREKHDSSHEDAFFKLLLEDQVPEKETCYSEFLCSLHKQINQKAK